MKSSDTGSKYPHQILKDDNATLSFNQMMMHAFVLDDVMDRSWWHDGYQEGNYARFRTKMGR